MDQMNVLTIALQYANKEIDLCLPIQVSIVRLKELLRAALSEIQLQLPSSFDLVVVNKMIRLKEADLLADYPLGDGDTLAIKERE